MSKVLGKNKVIGVIPARYESSRFPGKPLALIQGRPMIAWVVEGALKSKLLHSLIVATDDIRISKSVESLGIRTVMTDTNCPSGSDRIWQAIEKEDCDIVVNIQGDEPLVTGELVDLLVQPFLDGAELDADLDMTTLAHPISEEELHSDNCVKVVVNQKSEAMYFSRFPIPYSRMKIELGYNNSISGCLKHIGMYGYRKKFLKRYCLESPVILETAESLEQLRALYLGARIKVLKTEIRSLGVDTPEDLKKIEAIMRNGLK